MKYLKALALVLLLLLSTSCQNRGERTKPLLLASIRPYELLLTQLAGSEFEVKSIIPANASPHTWSPNPSDLKALMEASFILSNGMGLEENLHKSFSTRPSEHVEASALLKDVLPLISTGAASEHHHGHEHEGKDPHLWTSTFLMSRLITLLEKELSKRFPNSSLVFKQNADTMRGELNEVIELINEERNNYGETGLVTYHNSFYYFTHEFDIEYLGWVQFSPGKEPNPRDLAELGNTIKEHQVKAVFIEPQMSKKAGELLAKEFELKLLTIDPLGSDGKAKTISQLFQNNWDSMKEAFTLK